MRSLVVIVAVLASTSAADARSRHKHAAHAKPRVAIHGPIHGQSVGAPWQGTLREAAKLPEGDGYHIRRPWRSFGTRTTVDFVERVATDVRELFPETHVLAIGDLSAEHGGAITEHRSHQSGRDADIGLIYKSKPAGYPDNFITATEDNLDCAATYALVAGFAETSHDDGGALVMFLDFRVQGLLYQWARDHGVDDEVLNRTFQFPHGRGTSAGLVRHEPNHDNHLHVRFKCPRGDSACR
jgi:murein endopeptidase